MKRSLRFLLPLLFLPGAAGAQEGDHVMQSTRQLYEAVKGFVTQTVEQSPEEDFAVRPTDSVRTLAQLVGHIADANFMICSIALGEANPSTSSIEQGMSSKAELTAALQRSYQHCDRVYALSAQALAAPADLFGQPTTRFHAANLNVNHNFEHYGNLVTYVRLRGRVPASSQQ